MNKMLIYWQTQPRVMRGIVENRGSLTRAFVEAMKSVNPDRLYLVGSGTSRNASYAAVGFMQKVLKREETVVTPSDLPPIYAKNPMMVYLSQGGSSTNTLEAMERLSQYPYVSITGETDCEISKRSRWHMLIGCGQELVGPKTVGYTASVMCLYVCALESALALGLLESGQYGAHVERLLRACDDMEKNVQTVKAWFDQRQDMFSAIGKYALVGNGVAGLTLAEGALKILETIKVPTLAFEFEEYLHGPILITDEGLCGIFALSGEAEQRRRIEKLYQTHGEYSRYAIAMAAAGCAPQGEHVLSLQMSGEPETEPFEFVLLPQLLAACVPALMGLEEGNEIYDVYTGKCPTKFNNGR